MSAVVVGVGVGVGGATRASSSPLASAGSSASPSVGPHYHAVRARQRRAFTPTSLGSQRRGQHHHHHHHRRGGLRGQRRGRVHAAAAEEDSSSTQPTISDELACPRLIDTFSLKPLPSPFAKGGEKHSFGYGQKFVDDEDCVLLNALRSESLDTVRLTRKKERRNTHTHTHTQIHPPSYCFFVPHINFSVLHDCSEL